MEQSSRQPGPVGFWLRAGGVAALLLVAPLIAAAMLENLPRSTMTFSSAMFASGMYGVVRARCRYE
jgi:hypothetical protein